MEWDSEPPQPQSTDFGESIRTQTEVWLKGRLAVIYTDEGVTIFWNNPNAFLDGKSPEEMMAINPGRIERVIELLEQ